MEKYFDSNKKVVVLHSNDYGEGWSSIQANNGNIEQAYIMMFDKHLIEMYFKKSKLKEVKQYLKSLNITLSTFHPENWTESLTHASVEEGELITINNYDGMESIRRPSDYSFFKA